MDISASIEDAEARAKAAGGSVDDLCRVAGCHRATWQRWKAGKGEPGVGQWVRVQEYIKGLTVASADGEAAA